MSSTYTAICVSHDPALRHWHKTGDEPSVLADPPDCCRRAADRAREEAVNTAVRDERRRIVGEAAEAMAAYGQAACSVLDGHPRDLVAGVVEELVVAVRRTACICGIIETYGWDGTMITWPVQDPGCGVHGTIMDTEEVGEGG